MHRLMEGLTLHQIFYIQLFNRLMSQLPNFDKIYMFNFMSSEAHGIPFY